MRRPLAALLLLCSAELLGMSVWFTASAVTDPLRERLALSPVQAGWLTTIVQLGFVAGTAVTALFNLADLVPERTLVATSALAAALANAMLLLAGGFPSALATRFFTGFFIAGVYPPAMKMVATWYRQRRGIAIGALIGALTIGKATPYLVKALRGASVEAVIGTASAAAVSGALIVLLGYRPGPYPFPPRRFSLGLAGSLLGHRPTRLAIGGYLGHMWELYAMWAWVPAFLGASLAARGLAAHPRADWLAFGAIGAGGVGCLWGGWAADRGGRERIAQLAMLASGLCSLGVGLAFGGPAWLVALVTWTWGFFVVADSAQFSALVTEVAPQDAVGTALTLQTSMGFLLTMVTIELVPLLANEAGWRWAFPVLALGPAVGIAAIGRLRRLRAGEATPLSLFANGTVIAPANASEPTADPDPTP